MCWEDKLNTSVIQQRPGFFIIGAPKSGTTALSEYLRSHPEVVMSTPKEPHFFATDLPEYRAVTTEEDYLNLFQVKGEVSQKGTNLYGDASVWYLYSREALGNIHDYNPNAKIIIMLRDPLQMIQSMHMQHLYSRDEDIEDLEEAWNLQQERIEGRSRPKSCRDPKTLQYGLIARYGEQLERVYSTFPEKQVKVILFEDFAKDTGKVYRDVLAFLELDEDKRDKFEKINERKRHRSYLIANFIRRPPVVLRVFHRIMKRVGINVNAFRTILRKINTEPEEKVGLLSEKMEKKVADNYCDDVRKLEKMLSKDLEHWLGGRC